MFYHFFAAYKAEIPMYSWSTFKSIPLIERFLFFVMVIGSILLVIMTWLQNIIMAISSFICMMIALLGLYVADCSIRKKHYKILLERYKNQKLNPLIALLKRDEFNFYTKAKIEWLIKNCEVEISNNTYTSRGFSSFFERFLFPMITLSIGFVGSSASLLDTATIVVAICVFLLFLYFINSIIVPMAYEMFHPDREVLIFLKSELEYIKITLTE